MKLEAKQHVKGATKKSTAPPVEVDPRGGGQTSKLFNEIAMLKDQNKSLEGKVQVRRSF